MNEDTQPDMQAAMHGSGDALSGRDAAIERTDDEKPMDETKIDDKLDNEKHADKMLPTKMPV